MGSRRFLWLLVVSLCLVSLSAPASASALSLSAPVEHFLYSVDLDAVLSSDDPTGTVGILADGHAYRPRPAVPGDHVAWRSLKLPLGSLSVVAALRTPDGLAYSAPVGIDVWPKPGEPKLVTPSGGYAGSRTRVEVKVGRGTETCTLYFNGKRMTTRQAAPGDVVDMGSVSLPAGESEITIVAKNPVAETTRAFKVRRLDFPWPTCIIVDKSDFKLYWIRDGALVKAYPIAHGRPDSPTPSAIWRIDAKYHTDPSSVYGPRKMRLFRRDGSSYVYTAYAIHGTDQPWVIGTQASAGCIRMYNEDVLQLFPQVPLGTMVQTRY